MCIIHGKLQYFITMCPFETNLYKYCIRLYTSRNPYYTQETHCKRMAYCLHPPGDTAEDGVPVHQGDGDYIRGRHHCHQQSHQGHDGKGTETVTM